MKITIKFKCPECNADLPPKGPCWACGELTKIPPYEIGFDYENDEGLVTRTYSKEIHNDPDIESDLRFDYKPWYVPKSIEDRLKKLPYKEDLKNEVPIHYFENGIEQLGGVVVDKLSPIEAEIQTIKTIERICNEYDVVYVRQPAYVLNNRDHFVCQMWLSYWNSVEG